MFGGQLTAKSLQKYLFLFTRNQDIPSFDFIPYKYGCFSYQANQDVLTMQKYGYIGIVFKMLKETKNLPVKKLKKNIWIICVIKEICIFLWELLLNFIMFLQIRF